MLKTMIWGALFVATSLLNIYKLLLKLDKNWQKSYEQNTICPYLDIRTKYYRLDIISTNICNLNTTFLDLDIIIEDGRFVSKLYDKRRDFVFKVITFPNLRSNIPNKTSYGTFIGKNFSYM